MAPTESLILIQGPFEPISCLNLTRALATVPRRNRQTNKQTPYGSRKSNSASRKIGVCKLASNGQSSFISLRGLPTRNERKRWAKGERGPEADRERSLQRNYKKAL